MELSIMNGLTPPPPPKHWNFYELTNAESCEQLFCGAA